MLMRNRKSASSRYETLDGCTVIHATAKAIKIMWTDAQGNERIEWLPRSACDDGDALASGDTDISVQSWMVHDKNLPT